MGYRFVEGSLLCRSYVFCLTFSLKIVSTFIYYSDKDAVIKAVDKSGNIITAAGVIMVYTIGVK